MRRHIFYSKIHRATITQADLHYEGSISIDETLLGAAKILEHELVHVWNITQGTRLQTYALKAPAGSGVICINGAAAHGNAPGDLIIIATFCEMEEAEMLAHEPTVVRVDGQNRLLGTEAERPGPMLPRPLDEVPINSRIEN